MKVFQIIIILFALSISCLSFSQNNSFESFLLNSSISNNPDYLTEVDIIRNDGNAIFINVKVDNNNFTFLFDTGAMISLISKEAAGNTKLYDKINITDNLGNDQEYPTAKKDFAINNIFFKDVGFAVIDFNRINKYSCIKIDGIIGANAIKLCNWQINPVLNTIKLSDKIFIEDLSDSHIEIKYHSGLLPLIPVSLNGTSILSLLDTGDDGYITISKSSFEKLGDSKVDPFKGQGTYRGTFNDIIEERIEINILEKLVIGKEEFDRAYIYTTNDKSSIGNSFINNYITTLNIENNKLYLKPISENLKIIDEVYTYSLCPNEKGELIVCFIWDNKESKKSGIKSGDRITEFNGSKLDKITAEEYCRIKSVLRSSQSIRVKVKQGKNENEYILTKNNFASNNWK